MALLAAAVLAALAGAGVGKTHGQNQRVALGRAALRWERVQNLVAIDPATGKKLLDVDLALSARHATLLLTLTTTAPARHRLARLLARICYSQMCNGIRQHPMAPKAGPQTACG